MTTICFEMTLIVYQVIFL